MSDGQRLLPVAVTTSTSHYVPFCSPPGLLFRLLVHGLVPLFWRGSCHLDVCTEIQAVALSGAPVLFVQFCYLLLLTLLAVLC